MDKKTQENVSTRDRSPLYPSATIDECLEFLQAIDRVGGKFISVDAIADAVGQSVQTKSFKFKLTSARQFGLIQTANNTAQLTDLAKQFLYPTDDDNEVALKTQAFLNAPLYQKLAMRFENKAVPAIERLSNILMQEYSLSKVAKDRAAEVFIQSATQIGILHNGVLVLDGKETPSSKSTVASDNRVVAPEHNDSQNTLSSSAKNQNVDLYRFEIPTLSGASAQFLIPKSVTQKDIGFIKLYLDNMLPAFLDNLIDELPE